MAETVAFTLASKVLSTIVSPAFTATYKEGLSIWEAKDELSKLQVTVETIQAVFFDAERKQHGSVAVRNWIKRLKGVLYDADDLFDEVSTRDLLKHQIQKGNHNPISKKVLVSSSKLNPIISRYSIAKEVKEIRKSLTEISTDMAKFGFMICQNEVPTSGIRKGQDPGCFVDAKVVIGRDDDKKVALEMLFNELNSVVPVPLVIAIVGIGGLGKTTLAQLIYNDDEVKRNFDNRWFACISDTSDEREVLRKIFQSIHVGDHSSFSVSQLQTRIRDSVKDQKFLLVLDDVWEDHRGRWQDRMSLLSSCAKGSRIIVTTRLPSVVNAVSASSVHNLKGLSEEDAWFLFKRLAFAPDYENDPRRISLGQEILKRCRGVPLAIRSVGSLLSERNTIFEWQAIEREGLRTIEKSYNDEIMCVIKLSYDHLPSHLKHCFTYCSLFPKDYKFMKHELICLWLAQGYVEMGNEEIDFMHLLRRGFFQEAEKDELGEVKSCKMHDIMHDLALYVAGEETIALSGTTLLNMSSFTRHISLEDCDRDVPLLKVKRLRSFLLMGLNSICSKTTLDKLCQNFKMLRTLSLKGLGIEKNLPPSIGELKLLRYLDLSSNYFEELPDSITNLLNLLALNLMGCLLLKALPEKFPKLINLRYLNIEECSRLMKMPIGIEKLTRLQYLSEFVVGKGSGLDDLARLQQQLRGSLLIRFIDNIEDADECNWKLPVCLQKLEIQWYAGARIPDWGTINGIERTNNLAHLRLDWCKKVKYLPPLHCLPNLRFLELEGLWELKFVEAEDNNPASSPFFPRLQKLTLKCLPNLKRWMKRTTVSKPRFPILSDLSIDHCSELELASLPQCGGLRKLLLGSVDEEADMVPSQLPSSLFFSSDPTLLEDLTINGCKWLWSLQHEATASLRRLKIGDCSSLKSLQLASPHLRRVDVADCEKLVSLEVATSSLRTLTIRGCKELRSLSCAPVLMNALQELEIVDCPELDLREVELDWDSLTDLRMLVLRPMPPPENLPLFLQTYCQLLHQLNITEMPCCSMVDSE